jgi:hypothetical protein
MRNDLGATPFSQIAFILYGGSVKIQTMLSQERIDPDHLGKEGKALYLKGLVLHPNPGYSFQENLLGT